jgi:hypothetical protein
MRPSAGSILVIPLLLVLTTMFFALLMVKAFLTPLRNSQNICRSGLLETQRKVIPSLTQLLSLNEQVRALRKLKKAGDALYTSGLASGNPYLIAGGKALLLNAVRGQKLVSIRQKIILTKANTVFYRGYLGTFKNLETYLKATAFAHRRWNAQKEDLRSVLRYRIKMIGRPALAVRPVVLDEGPPEYELAEPFMFNQRQHISWTLTLETGIGGSSLWKITNIEMKTSCAASLQKKGAGFEDTLIKDKF